MDRMIRTDELLTTAAFRGELERVREMLDHGAVTTARCERLCTALHWAASMGHIDVAALLVERGADPNARSVNGETPLHVAAREGDATTAEFLIGVGANPRLCSTSGRTALELALEFADDEVELIQLLRQAQAQHDARALEHTAAAAEERKSRPKVQIVWESELLAQAQAPPPGTAIDSSCGSDEPLDLSDGAAANGCSGEDGDRANGDAELEARLTSACSLAPAEAPAPKASPSDDLDAGALSSLASKLFAWDASAEGLAR